MTNLKEIEKVTKKFEDDVILISKELKRVQSIKSRLKKQKFKSTYEKEMTEVISYEQVLKEARQLLEPKEKFVTSYTKEDVEKLDYDQTVKAIKSIQSKKANSRFLSKIEGDNDEYRNAEKIEKLLQDHRKNVKPLEETYIRKTDLVTIIDTIESSGKLSQEKILELLKELV